MESPNRTPTQPHRTTGLIKSPKPRGPDDKSIELNSSFLNCNGNGHDSLDNIEMITIQSVTYTSLKDLIPPPPSSSSLMSPSATRNSSWYECEIPIRNPLVKHAALAYLQPMLAPPDRRGDSLDWIRKVRDKCSCRGGGCIGWVADAVASLFRGVIFWGQVHPVDYDEEEEEEEEEKVD